jgi:divalent metal cation (Fe/Co/Zn/Cd) transporter
MKSGSSGRPQAVYGAIGPNPIAAAAKFLAAMFTESSAMLSEGIRSVADTRNQLLLLGVTRGRRPPDDLHPFGNGKELYSLGSVQPHHRDEGADRQCSVAAGRLGAGEPRSYEL